MDRLSSITSGLARLKSEVAAANVIAKLKQLASAYETRFDPNQPRVPAGSPQGGQWASGESEADSGDAANIAGELDTIAGKPEQILDFARRMTVAGRSLTYQQCMDICYPILERPKFPRWSDINATAYLRCMAACMQRNR